MRLPIRLIAALCVVAIGAAACAAEDAATDEPTSVTLLIDFFPSGNHAVFYTALGEGFFEEEGLNVEIEHVLGGTEVIRALEAGRAQFGLADFATMAVARQEQGANLLGVMGLQQETPMAILSRAEEEIEAPDDLQGLTVVDFAGSSTQIVWPVFLEENQLAAEDLTLELVEPAARLTLVVDRRADATVGFFTDNEPLLRQLCDCDVNVIRWKDWGIRTLSNGLVVEEGYAEANGDVVRGFVRALARALEFVRATPEGGVEHLMAFKDEDIPLGPEIVLSQTLNWLTLTTSPSGAGITPGEMTEEDWVETVSLMVRADQMGEPEDVSTFFTNEFLP